MQNQRDAPRYVIEAARRQFVEDGGDLNAVVAGQAAVLAEYDAWFERVRAKLLDTPCAEIAAGDTAGWCVEFMRMGTTVTLSVVLQRNQLPPFCPRASPTQRYLESRLTREISRRFNDVGVEIVWHLGPQEMHIIYTIYG